ncbi:hypothetical protein [Candidatus Accumulibacter contiguus]|uniref:hypothetical protein n=1 Tax=Candidatus Accumulibacter contiguus TaxID=2954381 RepID=UPI002FC32184
MSADLLFADARPGVNLVFGDVGNPPEVRQLGSALVLPLPLFDGPLVAGAVPVGMSVLLARPGQAIAIAPVPPLGSVATLAGPLPALSIHYDNAVNRAPFRWAGSSWKRAADRDQYGALAHRAPRVGQVDARIEGDQAARSLWQVRSLWQIPRRDFRPQVRIPWAEGQRRRTVLAEKFRPLSMAVRPAQAIPFEDALPRPQRTAAAWVELFRWARPPLAVPWEEGAPLPADIDLASGVGTQHLLIVHHPWQIGRAPEAGRSPIPPGPDPDPPWYVGDPDLLFPWLGSRAHISIPILRTYLVTNEVTLTRVSNSLALPALSLSVSIDANSWVWGWSASLPASYLDDVLPDGPGQPVELEAVVNDVNFRLLAEKITRDRRFGHARISVSGRGLAAALGAPYAPTISRMNAEDRTAQQLMNDALLLNGVSIGWDIDWHLTDWLVPAGVWSHRGSAIEACARIAAAAGGYLQASRTDRTLSVLPRYPVAPWDWSGVVPDYSLPSAATTREAVQWLQKPAYNSVYISGEGAGILAHVTRAGTAGDLLAPMLVDALTTHSDAARQRGISVLSDTGPQQLITLETPVFSGVGIYPVGAFVAFSDGANSRRGMVRSVSISAVLPTVRQTIEIECHE